MATLEEAFGVRNLNRVVTTFGSNEGNKVMQGLYTPDSNSDGEIFEWDEINFPRRMAPVSAPGAPSKNIVELGRVNRTTAMAHIKLNKRIQGRRIFISERGLGQLKPDAEAQVAREVKDLKNQIEKTIEYLSETAFTGTITVNSTTVEDSDISFTVTFAVQVFTKTASWATASTKILSSANELPLLKDTFVTVAGFPLARFLFNQTVSQYLMGNTEIQSWVQHTVTGVQIFEIGMISNMSGLAWQQYDGNYQPTGGAITKFIADGKMIGLPDQSNVSEYFVMGLGKGMIPKAAIGAPTDMLITPAPNSGWYSYATVETDPVAMKLIVGWVGIPIITYPKATIYCTVL